MNVAQRFTHWLETHWATPAYAGWLLAWMTLFFFMAAANTLAGWLYVISGVSLALLAVAALLSIRSLRGIEIRRPPLYPVSAGDRLTLELAIANPSDQPKSPLQIRDRFPPALGDLEDLKLNDAPLPLKAPWLERIKTQREMVALEGIPAQGVCRLTQQLVTRQRGVFHWQTVELRTAAPLGLFWTRRSRAVPGTVVVYPPVLPLTHCPLIDHMGQELSLLLQSRTAQAETATEGTTRSLRPYRCGDPLRLVHWRTSARYGELRVRELEVFTGGQQIWICLDSGGSWDGDAFEQAVIAAVSLYFYARRHQFTVQLWTAGSGPVPSDPMVLETLAQVQAGEAIAQPLPQAPLVWLSQNPDTLSNLPIGSRWLLWTSEPFAPTSEPRPLNPPGHQPGLLIQPQQPLQLQLQGMPT